jgi:hypothetical protein
MSLLYRRPSRYCRWPQITRGLILDFKSTVSRCGVGRSRESFREGHRAHSKGNGNKDLKIQEAFSNFSALPASEPSPPHQQKTWFTPIDCMSTNPLNVLYALLLHYWQKQGLPVSNPERWGYCTLDRERTCVRVPPGLQCTCTTHRDEPLLYTNYLFL